MESLQYLMINGCDSLTGMPRGFGQLTNLRVLPLFVVGMEDGRNDALRELNRLNKLRGDLKIKVLGTQENVNLSEANLEEKQYLKVVCLEGHRNEGCDEVMVEGLKPHPKLKQLTIEGLRSVMFSGCMSSFTNLTEIDISSSQSCRSITPLDQLPSLLSLSFQLLNNLEYISESVRASNSTTSTQAVSTTFFPSLKELTIKYCGILKGWRKINDDEDDQVTTTEQAQLLSFPCLSKLRIEDCPKLTCMPLYPTLEKLHLRGTSPKPLKQTMKMKKKTSVDEEVATPPTFYSTSFSPALSNLKSLYLQDSVTDVESILELLKRSTSLEKMSIFVSGRLNFCIHYSSSDERMTIEAYPFLYCQNDNDEKLCLDFLNNDDGKLCQWQGLRRLRHLKFRYIDTMLSLPKWIHLITHIQDLEIFCCKNLMSLPEGMQLQELRILDCPRLIERCGNNKGVDWPKIAHIPNIKIDEQWIQRDGCYHEVENI